MRCRRCSSLKLTNKPFDAAEFASETRQSVAAIVRKQIDLGIDIVSDGEQSKTSFQYYIAERLMGWRRSSRSLVNARRARTWPFQVFMSAARIPVRRRRSSPAPHRSATPASKQLAADLANLKAALAGVNCADIFVPSVSPSSCAGLMENRYYKSAEEHVFAVAEALREEYEAIVAAGFQVQIDDPRLAMHYMLSPGETVAETRAWASQRIAALNHALRNLPPERVRHHTCYGINMGPRTSDMELKHLADLIVTIRAGYYSFEMANPRHEHEWRVWEHVKLPEGKVLVPGCITHASVSSNIPSSLPIASFAWRGSSGANGSSLAPTAALPRPSRPMAGRRSIPILSGRNSRVSPRARDWRRRNCGPDVRQPQTTLAASIDITCAWSKRQVEGYRKI